MDILMDWVDRTFGPAAMIEAWAEFVLWDEHAPPADLESPHRQLFWPWFCHAWRPGVLAESNIDENPARARSMVQRFLHRGAPGCDPRLRRYLEACSATSFSFFEVLSGSEREGFALRNLVTGEHTPTAHRKHPLPTTIEVSDILYGLCVRVDDIAQLEACAPIAFPRARRPELIERCLLPVDIERMDTRRLCRHDLKLRAIYFDVAGEALLARMAPEEGRLAAV